jgi:predicted PurR-regulated permease PerM
MVEPDTQIREEAGRIRARAAAQLRSRPGHWAMNVIGIAGIVALCYYGELVLAVLLVAVLVAFTLAPVVDLLMLLHLPRALAALIVVLLLMALLVGLVYFSYNEAATLAQDLPKYAGIVRAEVLRFRKGAENLAFFAPRETGVVRVRQATNWTDILTRGFGSVGTAILVGSFIPVLAYFMLTWQEHVRSATVMLFPLESRHTAYVTIGLISAMIRSFMAGNLLIGLVVGGVSTGVFWCIHLPFFYFVGFISGFLNLVPYLGVLLALVPPVFVGIGHVEVGAMATIFVTVFAMHLIALNVLYPKLLGNRLRLNPLALTLGLLFWGALWGGIGLLLAVPLTAAMKIVCDNVETLKPYGAWLGE